MERAEVRKYLAQIENLIKNAGLEGIHFEGISATYGDSDLSVKIKFNTVSEDGIVNHDREEAYLSYVFGNLGKKNLPKKFIGAKVKVRDAFGGVNRVTYTISGAKPRAQKNSVIITNISGKRYVIAPQNLEFV